MRVQACTPSAFSRALLLLSGVAALAVCGGGCRNKREQARQKAELTARLARFTAQVGELRQQASGLRARVDRIPEDLPGVGPVRDDLHTLEEVIGVEDGRSKWLASELDKAFASGSPQQIEAVSRAIPQGDDGLGQSMVKMMHELLPLERLASQRRYFESLDAAKAAGAGGGRRPSKTQ